MSATRIVGVVSLLSAAACYTSTAPEDWLGNAESMQRGAYGGWITVTRTDRSYYSGELIAAQQDSIYILNAAGLVVTATSDMTAAKMETFRAKITSNAFWGTAGAFSTLSHGFVLILTAPLWIISTTAATAAYSRAPLIKTTQWSELAPYARFPQGMPRGLDRARLRMPAYWR
jgi:hypothetical protein